MTDTFKKPEEVRDWLKERVETYRTVRSELGRKLIEDICMDHGKQWLMRGDDRIFNGNYLSALPTTWDPDSNHLRVTVNRTRRFRQKAEAATFTNQIDVEVFPPDLDCGVPGAMAATVMETLANVTVDKSSLLRAWRNANHMRSVCGRWLIGAGLSQLGTRSLNLPTGQANLPDARLRCFDTDFTKLTLDPAKLNLELPEHDEIVFSEVWTVTKIRRVLGLDENALPDDDLRTVGDLTSTYEMIRRLTGGRLFSHYATHSKTKGAWVHQIHLRDPQGYFSTMLIAVEKDNLSNLIVTNLANPVSPFGGCGLPFMEVCAHRASDGFGYESDVRMMKDDQDRLNLMETFKQRIVQRHSGFQWLVDKRSIYGGKSEEDFAQQFNNMVGGVNFYEGPTRDKMVQPPKMIQPPPPPPFIQEAINQIEDELRRDVHRSEGNFGVTQTHVPNASFQRALEESDEVHGQRVREDLERGEEFVGTLVGTQIGLVHRASPSILGDLRDVGMEESDLAVILQSDPRKPPCRIKIRESTVRYRSYMSRRQDLDLALQNKAISAFDYRMATSRDLDSPVTMDDQFYTRKAQQAAFAVLTGMEWTPMAAGPYSEVFISEFRKALFDKRAQADQNVQQRLTRAIIAQIQAQSAEVAMRATIEGQGQQQQGGAPQPQGQGSPEESGEGGEASVDDVLATIESHSAANPQ